MIVISILIVGFSVLIFYFTHVVLMINSFSAFKVVHTKEWRKFMEFRRSFRNDRSPEPLPEISASDLTLPLLMDVSKHFGSPVIVRNTIEQLTIEQLKDIAFWTANYGNESVNCVGPKSSLYDECSVNTFFSQNVENGMEIYSKANHFILYEHPELLDMLKTPITDWINAEPLHEIFIGFKSGISPLHADYGLNLFKQITGSKKWTLIDPAELPYVNLHITDDSAFLRGYHVNGEPEKIYSNTTWLQKINRFEVTVRPGDLLVVPAFWMHIVEPVSAVSDHDENSIESKTDLIISVPERYFDFRFGFRSAPFLTTQLIAKRLLQRSFDFLSDGSSRICNGQNGKKLKKKTAFEYLPLKSGKEAYEFDAMIRQRVSEHNSNDGML